MSREAEIEKSKLSYVEQNQIEVEMLTFYVTIINYIELWKQSFEGSSCFNWMFMSCFPDWDTVKESYEYAVSRYDEKLRGIINRDQLFDEYGYMKLFCQQNINKWMDVKLSCEKIWVRIFVDFQNQNLQLVHMEKLVQFSFFLPETSTVRVFSLIFNILGDEKGQMNLATVSAFLDVQFNSNLNCNIFYEKVKVDRKIQNSDKYKPTI